VSTKTGKPIPSENETISVKEVITAQIEQIAREQRKALRPLTDDLVLLDSGLDSLCLAILVARLEDQLGCDPFSIAEEDHLPVTFADFVRLYEDAVT
jgi:acyl carrier protein